MKSFSTALVSPGQRGDGEPQDPVHGRKSWRLCRCERSEQGTWNSLHVMFASGGVLAQLTTLKLTLATQR
eukprot:5649106-Prymnesium_polylepis.1